MAADAQAGALMLALPALAHLVNPNAADLKTLCDRGWTITTLDGTQHTVTQILRIGMHPRRLQDGRDSIA